MNKGYRINYPEQRVAWKALQFEYEELANEHILDDMADFLGVKGDWSAVLNNFRQKYADAIGIWLTMSKKAAMELYGQYGGDLLVYEYNPNMIITDLGYDGLFALNPQFVREE